MSRRPDTTANLMRKNALTKERFHFRPLNLPPAHPVQSNRGPRPKSAANSHSRKLQFFQRSFEKTGGKQKENSSTLPRKANIKRVLRSTKMLFVGDLDRPQISRSRSPLIRSLLQRFSNKNENEQLIQLPRPLHIYNRASSKKTDILTISKCSLEAKYNIKLQDPHEKENMARPTKVNKPPVSPEPSQIEESDCELSPPKYLLHRYDLNQYFT